MRVATLALALSLGSGSALAQELYRSYGYGYGYGYGPAAVREPAQPAAPDEIVRRGIDRLTGFVLGALELSPESLQDFLALEIGPLFDFDYMARWAAGRYWSRLDGAQRTRLAATLERLFLEALANNLGTYAEPLPRIDVFAPRRTGATEAQVFARVVGERGLRMRLEFRFYWDGSAWRVYDVTANGASAVAYYRAHFRQSLRRHGLAALDP